MKRLLLIIIIALSACNSGSKETSDEDKAQRTDAELKTLEAKGKSSKLTTDTIFLGYRFGMSKTEASRHAEKLYRSGKFKIDFDNSYFYEIPAKSGGFYKGFIRTDFYNNKLMQLRIVFNDPYPILVFSQLSDMYEDKYGPYDIMNKPYKDMAVYEKYWIRNNLKIQAQTSDLGTSIEYTDLRVESQKLAEDSIESEKREMEQRKAL